MLKFKVSKVCKAGHHISKYIFHVAAAEEGMHRIQPRFLLRLSLFCCHIKWRDATRNSVVLFHYPAYCENWTSKVYRHGKTCVCWSIGSGSKMWGQPNWAELNDASSFCLTKTGNVLVPFRKNLLLKNKLTSVSKDLHKRCDETSKQLLNWNFPLYNMNS